MEQKEKNNAVKEFLKRFLESAKCSPEMIAYLNEVDEAVFCEYYCFCFLDGMSVEEVREIDSIPAQNWEDKIRRIREARRDYLEKLFVPNSEMQQQISELYDKAGKVFHETEELRTTLNTTLQQALEIQKNALTEQKESYQNMITAKEELIRERDGKIQSLLQEIEWNKATWEKEKKALALQLE